MNFIDAAGRLHRAHEDAGLGSILVPGHDVDRILDDIAAAIAPMTLPGELVDFWRSVDPDSLAIAPCPRPAGPALALRLWRRHLSATATRDAVPYFPWCYESHEFGLVALEGPATGTPGPGSSGVSGEVRPGCYEWSGPGTPYVRVFGSVTDYLDLLATMIELHEFTHHRQLGVVEFDPARQWADARTLRHDKEPRADQCGRPITTISALQERAELGETPAGLIRGRVVALHSSGAGHRVSVTDGTALLDLWCPAAVGGVGPALDRRFEFDVTLTAGPPVAGDVPGRTDRDLYGVNRALRDGDVRAAVAIATPLYDKLFGMPAAAQACSIRFVG